MVTWSQRAIRRSARIPFAPVVALMFATAVAIVVAAVPIALFERAIMKTGLPALVSIAGPPLGLKARIFGIVVAFAAAGGIAWLVATPIARVLEADRRRRTPWADAGYLRDDGDIPDVDARRRPIFATDELGAPLMSDAALSAPPPLELAAELEAPLTVEEFAPSGENIGEDGDAPKPLNAAIAPAEPTHVDQNSIAALIRRLEAGLAKRGLDDPDPSAPAPAPLPLSSDWIVAKADSEAPDEPSNLRSALGTLRRLAAAR